MLDRMLPAIRYGNAVRGEEAVILDWQDSRKVAALPIEIPAGVKWASSSSGQHPPAVAKARDLRFFVLLPGSFESLYKREAYEEFWEVTPAGFRHFEYRPGGKDWEETHLRVTEIPFDQPQKLAGSEPEPEQADSERDEKAE